MDEDEDELAPEELGPDALVVDEHGRPIQQDIVLDDPLAQVLGDNEIKDDEGLAGMIADAAFAPGDRPPSYDDAHPGYQSYRDWNDENSFVISGPIGPVARFPGRRFNDRKQALAWCLKKYGRVYEHINIFGRWCYRVAKPGSRN